ncbi:hypothetical protein ENH_00048090 [Eimeria necatrix]|uniref:Uncharacterized protein n=1 Tax=Eimeria necatrix TaxID=51315 RepID=U6MI32_9EIME|nr:hypothetical protein ENH_00048090 [Eimeria necatrix]CDJ63671.1 hypothetical protein ENH_00048090 [Eimeria necatrix]
MRRHLSCGVRTPELGAAQQTGNANLTAAAKEFNCSSKIIQQQQQNNLTAAAKEFNSSSKRIKLPKEFLKWLWAAAAAVYVHLRPTVSPRVSRQVKAAVGISHFV